jgi:pimeloyl-ACP methyl ester carboxylesterase
MIARALPRRDTADHASRLAATVALAFAALLMLLPLLAVSAATAPRVEAASRPTIVLVHGAWAGPDGWDTVVAGLQKDGYRTSTPALGLQSTYADVAIVRNALDAIPGNKILVGHSYGGSVISQAAAGRTDVLGLVYTAAFVPDAGETLIGLGAGYQPPAALQPGHLVFLGEPFASPSIIAPDVFRSDFAADLNPKLASQLAGQQVPTSFGLFFEPAGPVAWHALPSWYAVSGLDQMIDPALQRFLAARMGATTVTFDEASHAGGYTHYSARLVKLIEAAATATAR